MRLLWGASGVCSQSSHDSASCKSLKECKSMGHQLPMTMTAHYLILRSVSVVDQTKSRTKYRMARNFRGLKISRFSRITNLANLILENFTLQVTCILRICSAWCYLSAHDLESFLVYFAQLLCRYDYRYFQASEKSSCKLPNPCGPLSRLIPSSSIVSARESAECVGKQEEHSEWEKGTTLLQARSRTEG